MVSSMFTRCQSFWWGVRQVVQHGEGVNSCHVLIEGRNRTRGFNQISSWDFYLSVDSLHCSPRSCLAGASFSCPRPVGTAVGSSYDCNMLSFLLVLEPNKAQQFVYYSWPPRGTWPCLEVATLRFPEAWASVQLLYPLECTKIAATVLFYCHSSYLAESCFGKLLRPLFQSHISHPPVSFAFQLNSQLCFTLNDFVSFRGHRGLPSPPLGPLRQRPHSVL